MESQLYACMWVYPWRDTFFDMKVSNRNVDEAVKKFSEAYAEDIKRYQTPPRVVGVAFYYHLRLPTTFKGRKVTLWAYSGESKGFARRSYPGAQLLTWQQAAEHDSEFAQKMKEKKVKYALLLPFSVGMYSHRLFGVKEARVYGGYVTASFINGLVAKPWYVLHPTK